MGHRSTSAHLPGLEPFCLFISIVELASREATYTGTAVVVLTRNHYLGRDVLEGATPSVAYADQGLVASFRDRVL